MKIQQTVKTETLKIGKVAASAPLEASIAARQNKAGAGILLFLFLLLAASSASAQAFIRFTLTQGRVTVPVNSVNSTIITNAVNLSGGTANASFDVSGLPAGATAVLTDTNGNALTSTTMDTNLWLTVNTANIPEGLYNFRLNAGGFDTNGLPVTNSIVFVLQAAHIWNGSLNVSNAWSDASAWLGGSPGAADDAVFTDQGAQTNVDANGISFTNSFVTASTTIGSLRFSQTGYTNSIATNPPPIFHHVHILPAQTLTVSGTNGFSLMRDYFDDAAAGLNNMNVTIDGGAGSKLVLSNQVANVTVFVGGSLVPTLNMSNLDNLAISVSRVGIADYLLYPNYRDLNTGLNVGRDTNSYSARPRQMSGNIYFAKTNVVLASYVDSQNYTNEYTRSYPFTLYNNEQNGVGSGTSQQFILGVTNRFLVDAVCFYGANGNGTTRFSFTNSGAVFRGTNGTSRMSVFTVSDDGGTNEAASNQKGTVDFSGNNGVVDILVDRLYLSRDRELIQTNQTPNVQSDLTIGRGIVDANTAVFGFQEHTKPDWTLIGGGQAYLDYCQGRLVVTNGGTFRVNGTLTLGYTADTNSSADAQQYGTYGQITIYSNSIVTASNIVCDGGLNFYDSGQHLPGQTPRANNITINLGGNLIVTNGIGANNYADNKSVPFANQGLPGLPLDNLTIGQGGILTLFVSSGKTNVFTRNLASTGATPGTIKIASLPAGLSFPATIPLINYQTATPVLTADVSAAAVTALYPGVQGYILNDTANQNIDLFLTTNAPNILIWTGNQSPNWNLTDINWKTAVGGIATNFSMGDVVNFDDSSSVTNINITDVVVPNQATTGMTITNSANIYTFNTVSGGQIAGTAKIIKQGTNDVIFNAPEAGPIIVTAGEIDVLSGGILGGTTLFSNTVLNVTSGGFVSAGLNSTNSTVTVASGGSILGGGIILAGGSLVNNGTISVPGTLQLIQNNNAVLTNNGIMNFGSANPAWDSLPGTTVDNAGTVFATAGRVIPRGLWFGTGTVYDPVTSAPTSGSLARFNLKADPNAFLSVGATPSGSIGNMFVQGRLDLSDAANMNNAGGKFLVEVDTVNHINDTITATRWNDIGGCYWVMTNLTGTFQSGQNFNVLINANGAGISNLVDTVTLYPTVLPTVPGPGLEWNLTGLQNFGTIGVTNSTMVWDGSGNGSWDTNNSANNWKTTPFGNNQGAVFDDSASGSTTVTLNTPVAPGGFNATSVTNIIVGVSTNVVVTVSQPTFMPGIVVSNAAKDYTFVANGFTNRITGMTGIYKTGPGTLTVLSSNDFVGGLTIDGGTFAMTNATALGIANGTALNGGITFPSGISAGSANQIYNQVSVDNNATVKYFGTTNQNLNHYVTINQNGGTFEVSSNTAQLTLNDNVLGTGALTKTGLGMLILNQTGDAYAGGTIVNAGTLRLTAVAAGPSGITLANSTILELTNSLSFTNVMNVTGTGVAINVQGVSTNVSGGVWTGSGTATITTTNAVDLFVFNADLSGFSGTISFGTSSNTFRFNNSTNNSSSKSLGSTTATFALGTGAAVLNNFIGAGLTYDLGALSGGANTILTGRATNSTTSVAATTYSIGAKGVDSTFAGTISNGFDTVSVIKVGGGKLLLNGNSIYTGSTTVSNGVLGGIGSIASPLTVAAGGILSPGAPIGTFTVSNNVTLGGTVLMELNQAGSPANDMLAVTGTITGGGVLVVTNVGPDIVNGSTFKLFSKPVTGFVTVTLPVANPSNTSSYTWANNLAVDGSITLVSGGMNSTVNPNPTNIVTSVSGGVLTLSWPADHTGWTLQVETNPLSVGLYTNWFIVAGSSSTNSVSVPIDANNGSVFYRLTLP